MDDHATGIVVRTRPLTESSLIVNWLTPGAGRIATVARGARRPKSPFRGRLDLFYRADFSFIRSRRSDLHQLKEVVVGSPNEALRKDLSKLVQASYCAALIELTTEPESPLPVPFTLMSDLLDTLGHSPAAASLVLAFELRLLRDAGLSPQQTKPPPGPGAARLMALLETTPWADIPALEIPSGLRLSLERFLGRFLEEHFQRLPRGRRAALMHDANPTDQGDSRTTK